MKKRKDYLRLFVNYCLENEVAFEVGGGGYILCLRFVDSGGVFGGDPLYYQLGYKSAYEWLVKEHKESLE